MMRVIFLAVLAGVLALQAEFYYYQEPSNAFPDERVTSISSDDEIMRKIQEKLNSATWSKKIEGANFQVSSGAVTIQGEVKTQSDRDRIANEIRRISGVRSIDNQITVQRRY